MSAKKHTFPPYVNSKEKEEICLLDWFTISLNGTVYLISWEVSSNEIILDTLSLHKIYMQLSHQSDYMIWSLDESKRVKCQHQLY